MKKLFTVTLLSIFTFLNGFAQKLITYKSFAKAVEESKKTKKPILLIVDVDRTNLKSPSNLPPNVKINYSSGIDDAEVINKFNESLIVYKTFFTDTNVVPLLRLAKIQTFPSYLFLNQFKDIIYKDFGNSTSKEKYLKMVNGALLASKEKSISEIQKDYEADKSDNLVIKKLIDLKRKTGITDNAELIEQYVKNLKIGDFNDYQTVLYILEAGPYSDGVAYKMAYNNRKNIDSIYKYEPLKRRTDINNAIISNTMMDAYKTKNNQRAMAGANFARNTWTRDYRAGEKSYYTQLLWYYKAVKDTSNYFRNATYFYDNYYMNIGADSIKKIEAKNLVLMRQNVPKPPSGGNIVSKEKMDSLRKKYVGKEVYTTTSYVTTGTPSNTYANALNTAAWNFYLTNTKNINHLSKAMIWSRRSIELAPTGAYYDTLAHILYRMGYFEEAIKTQEDAISISKREGQTSPSMQESLKMMKAKTL